MLAGIKTCRYVLNKNLYQMIYKEKTGVSVAFVKKWWHMVIKDQGVGETLLPPFHRFHCTWEDKCQTSYSRGNFFDLQQNFILSWITFNIVKEEKWYIRRYVLLNLLKTISILSLALLESNMKIGTQSLKICLWFNQATSLLEI